MYYQKSLIKGTLYRSSGNQLHFLISLFFVLYHILVSRKHVLFHLLIGIYKVLRISKNKIRNIHVIISSFFVHKGAYKIILFMPVVQVLFITTLNLSCIHLFRNVDI